MRHGEQSGAPKAARMTVEQVHEILASIPDPEMPISIVDLGIVQNARVRGGDPVVEIDITPTFVGCPALDVLEGAIRQKLMDAGATQVNVRFVHDPPWSVERITDSGREALRRHGVTVPRRGFAATTLVPLTIASAESVACPFCGSASTNMESAFGPTRCRTIYYCSACKNQFEHMKPI
jgi:ring-1,2-phenylacetyl-CoA epoxidase subunit PaaD